jgi:hypothetical protein
MLFSDRSLWTMMHGIVLGGAALMALFAAVFAMRALYPADGPAGAVDRQSRSVARLTLFVALLLWVTVLTGTYIIFPPYRATPPPGATELAAYPRSMLLASPETAWLHAFAMESKEHMPWIAAMLATSVAFVAIRYRSTLAIDPRMRRMAMTLLVICFALVSFIALMGIFVNKVAPLE